MPQSSCRAGGAARTEPAPAEPSNLPRVHQRIQGELGKTTAGAEEKLLSQKRKAICVPGWTPLAPMEEEKEIFQREGKKKKHTKKKFKSWNAQTEKKHHKKTWAKKALWASLPRGSTQPHGLSVPFAFCVAHGQRVQCWRSGSRRCETRTKLSSGFGEERLRTYEDD